MNQQSIAYRKNLFEDTDFQNCRGRWRHLYRALPTISKPAIPMTQRHFQTEFGEFRERDKGPMETYWSDLIKNWEGEVAEVQGWWEYSDEAMPRNKALWHHQFALSEKQCGDFLKLGKQPAVGDGLLPNTCDVETLGSTTILRRYERRNGHWRRRAHVTVLAKLFYDLGSKYTAQELVFWWINARKIVKKREHPQSSPDRMEASDVRKKYYGGAGFSKHEKPRRPFDARKRGPQ